MIGNLQGSKWTYTGPGEGKGQVHRVIDYTHEAVTGNGLVVTVTDNILASKTTHTYYGRWKDFLHLFRRC